MLILQISCRNNPDKQMKEGRL